MKCYGRLSLGPIIVENRQNSTISRNPVKGCVEQIATIPVRNDIIRLVFAVLFPLFIVVGFMGSCPSWTEKSRIAPIAIEAAPNISNFPLTIADKSGMHSNLLQIKFTYNS